MPAHVGRVAFMADPFRTPLEGLAALALLHDQFVTLRSFPEFLAEAVTRRARSR